MLQTTEGLYALISKTIDQKINKYLSGNKDGVLQTLTGTTIYSERKLNEIANELSKFFAKQADFQVLSAKLDDLSHGLEYVVDDDILTGLDVTATSPPSMRIDVSAGYGGAKAQPCILESAKTIRIPADPETFVFYVTLQGYGGLNVRKSRMDGELTLAKIIIPKPGITIAIVDDKPDDYSPQVPTWMIHGYDGWIVSAKDMYFDQDQKFDEDSIEVLRDNIGKILADNLIGNIRLSEDLKIINTQGTLEMDSKELRLKDINGEVLSKFTRDGVYFFDKNGVEKAHFSNEDARIGNILITQTTVESTNFVSGHLGSGFRIEDSGDAEFMNVVIRGKMTTSVFEKDTISVIGGSLLVMDGDILAENMTVLDSSTLEISGDTTFAVGDSLQIKDGIDVEWMQVTAVSGNTYTITRDKDSQYSANANPAWKKGTSVVNFGASGEGGVYLTSSESNAPYISIVSHAGAPWNTLTTHLRLGNLNGFLGYSTDKYGIAIGTADSYLKYDPINGMRIKGSIIITSGTTLDDISDGTTYKRIDANDVTTNRIDLDKLQDGTSNHLASTNEKTGAGRAYADIDASGNFIGAINPAHNAPAVGAGLYLGGDYLGYYDSSNWKTYMDNAGNFYLGGVSGSLQWNGTTLSIVGIITVSATSSGIASFSDAGNLATTNEVDANVLNMTNAPAEAGADVTSGHTAADIAGQGNLATTNEVDANVLNMTNAPAEAGADVTSGHTAADTTAVNGLASSSVSGWAMVGHTTYIDGGDIYTNTVTANAISVTNLSAINADLGTITAGIVTGATLQTATSGSRILMDTNKLIAYDDGSAQVFKIAISGGDVGDVVFGSATDTTKQLKWDKSANDLFLKGYSVSALLRTTTANMIYYVSTSGDNDNDGTSGSPFRTIQHAIDQFPEVINHNAYVYLQNSLTYDEEVILQKRSGWGKIGIFSQSNDETKVLWNSDAGIPNFDCLDCSVSIHTQGISFMHKTTALPCISMIRCQNAGIIECSFSDNGVGGANCIGCNLAQGTYYLDDLDDYDANKCTYGVKATLNAHVGYLDTVFGDTTFLVETGAIITAGVIDP